MGRNLIAYFSASGVTEGLAKTFQKALGGDLFEIVPVEPYTNSDLNWNDKESRSTKESKDKNIHPAIRDRVARMDDYDTVYVGFPIWWYTAPNIIFGFLASYDLAGKTVIPFATSGGSPIGRSASDMRAFAEGADVKEGKRFSATASADEIKRWAASLS